MRCAASLMGLTVLAVGAVAEAQNCAPGRVPTLEGYCCWPAQSWSDEHQRCEGPPSCPDGMSAEGDDCVGAMRAPAPVLTPPGSSSSAVTTPPSYGGGGWQQGAPASEPSPWRPRSSWQQPAPAPLELDPALAGTAWPESALAPGATNPRHEPRLDAGLFGAGLALIGAGYVASVATAVVAFESPGIRDYGPAGFDTTCHDTAGAFFLVPVVGALIAGIVHGTCTVPTYERHIGVSFRSDQRRGPIGELGYLALSVASSAVQLAGAVMALVALAVPRTVVVYDPPPSVSVSLTPHASPTSIGLNLQLGWL